MRASSFYWVSIAGAILVVPVLCFSEVTFIDWVFAAVSLALFPLGIYSLSKAQLPQANRLFWMLLLCYLAIHFAYEFSAYQIGLRAFKDTAAFVQCFWNLLHKGDFATTIDGQYSFVPPMALNHFARHTSPILFLALIPFAIHEDISSLIVLHTLILAVTGALAWYWVRLVFPKTNEKPLAALLPFILLGHAALFVTADFDETIFLPPLLLWSAIAFKRERKWQFIIGCVLIAAVKEMTIPLLLTWSLVALWRRRSLLFVLSPAVIGGASFIISFFWVIPHYSVGSASPFLTDIYAAGQTLNPSAMALYWFQILSMWGPLPLFSPLSLLAASDLLMNAFFSGPMPYVVLMILHYQVAIACAFFLGTTEILPRISGFLESRIHISDPDRFLIVLQATLIVASLQWAGVPIHYLYDQLRRGWSRDLECIHSVALTREPVAADYQLCGYFAKRDVIWSWNTIYLPEGLYAKVEWFVGVKTDTIPPPVVGWDTVCVGENVFVLKNPQRELPTNNGDTVVPP